MPIRILEHGRAGTTDTVGLEDGTWNDVSVQGQFLIDLEFLSRYSHPSSGTCVYCKSPPYLAEIAAQFPWLHFYAYQHTQDHSEYDPTQPELESPLSVQVRSLCNMTIARTEFTKDMARIMGDGRNANRVLICHGVDKLRQLALHALLRPNYTLMDVCGVIPEDYLWGEIILPVFIPINKIFASLVVWQGAKWGTYNPETFKAEIGFFQAVIRGVHQGYDYESRDFIATEYAKSFHGHNALPEGCPEEILKAALLSTVDMLGSQYF